jgi:hypothetical protein
MTSLLLPPQLIASVQEQRAILFLGAGVSFGAFHPKTETVPSSDELRNKLCDKFLGGALKDRPLTAVAALAASEAGLVNVQKFIRDLFIDFGPADFHLLIPTYRWRAIATTNFDLIIERAYEKSRGAVQRIVKSVKDGDLFDTRMNQESDPVGFMKLHGCIDHYTDETIPLVLGQEQYLSYAANRTRFYDRLRDLAYENPIIFCGYSISDPHIQQLLFDLTDKSKKRPMYYYVAPNITDIESRYWGGNHVACIRSTMVDVLNALDEKISTTARRLRRDVSADQLSIFPHFKISGAMPSDDLRFYIENDVVHLHSGLVASRQDAIEFYKGYDRGFGCIAQDLDIRRPVTDSVLVDAVLLDEGARKNGELFLLKGPGGNGKTVALKRVAWEAGISYDKVSFFVDGAAGIRFGPLEEIF